MKRSVLRAVVLGSAFVLAALPVKAEEKKISPGELPDAVIKAVKKRFHEAEIRGASKETGKKGTVFEVALKRGREELEVSLNPEGKILEIESKIDVKDLPEHIRKSIEHKYPGAKLAKVEKIQKGDEEPSYEVVVAPKSFEVKVDHHGKLAGDRKDGDDEDEDEEHEHGVKAKGERGDRHDGDNEKHEHGFRERSREGGRFNGRDRRDDERGPRGRRWERRRDRDDD